MCQVAAVDEVTARKRRFSPILIVGSVAFAGLSIALAAAGFPGTSNASMVFFTALGISAVLALVSYGARMFVKVPPKWRLTKWILVHGVSRMCVMAAEVMLLALALLALPFGHGMARLLFHAIVVALLIAALWMLASDAALNFALLSKRFRASIAQPE